MPQPTMDVVEKTLSIPSDKTLLPKIRKNLESHLKTFGLSEIDIFKINLAFEEALVNAVIHGNNNNPTKNVSVIYRIAHQNVEIKIIDEGVGFSEKDLINPLDEGLERECGRGLLLMRQFMSVTFDPPGNQVTMIWPKKQSAKNIPTQTC